MPFIHGCCCHDTPSGGTAVVAAWHRYPSHVRHRAAPHINKYLSKQIQEIDRLLSSIVRRQPGQAPPPGSVPVSGRGAGRGMPPGAAGRGAGPAGAAAAMRTAAAARAAAAGGRGNGTGPAGGRGPPPPPGAADNRPKLRWDQSNEEVEIIIRVDPSEFFFVCVYGGLVAGDVLVACICSSFLARRLLLSFLSLSFSLLELPPPGNCCIFMASSACLFVLPFCPRLPLYSLLSQRWSDRMLRWRLRARLSSSTFATSRSLR